MSDFDYGGKRPDGQYERHPGLPEAERKDFIRPVRDSYRHVGPPGPAHPLRDLTADEHERYDQYGYVKFEAYPEDQLPKTGRYWTQEKLDKVRKGCGMVTQMPVHCAETYAKQPSFYSSTFCSTCGGYFPVGAHGEFVWLDDGTRVGT